MAALSSNGAPSPDSNAGRQGAFAETHWSLILAAGGSDSRLAADALERLCAAYWYPIYAYLRRSGRSQHEAEDLTQGFFAHLLRREAFRTVAPGRAKFRTFLLTALKRYAFDEWARSSAQKRGGGQTVISFDAEEAEQRYRIEPSHSETPEKLFERRWVFTLLDRVLVRLEKEFRDGGKEALFVQLREFIFEGATDRTYAEVGLALGMGEEAVKKAAQRMRQRYQEFLREEIGRTVATAGEVEEELRHLRQALRS